MCNYNIMFVKVFLWQTLVWPQPLKMRMPGPPWTKSLRFGISSSAWGVVSSGKRNLDFRWTDSSRSEALLWTLYDCSSAPPSHPLSKKKMTTKQAGGLWHCRLHRHDAGTIILAGRVYVHVRHMCMHSYTYTHTSIHVHVHNVHVRM